MKIVGCDLHTRYQAGGPGNAEGAPFIRARCE